LIWTADSGTSMTVSIGPVSWSVTRNRIQFRGRTMTAWWQFFCTQEKLYVTRIHNTLQPIVDHPVIQNLGQRHRAISRLAGAFLCDINDVSHIIASYEDGLIIQ
jgi:hypothetical protein